MYLTFFLDSKPNPKNCWSRALGPVVIITVGGRMFWGMMQDFNFAQIWPNHFCPNFASILPKEILIGSAAAFLAPVALVVIQLFAGECAPNIDQALICFVIKFSNTILA